MKSNHLILISIFFSSISLFGQDNLLKNEQGFENKMDSLLNRYAECDYYAGFSVGILKNNKVIYKKGFGVKDLQTNESVTDSSLFHMASVSKPFVATAIMQLVEQGKINLDSSLIHYLPYLKMDDNRYSKITIRHVLTHTTGIPDVEDYEWDNPQYDDEAAERYVHSLDTLKLEFNPGEKFSYCNTSFDILADVIAKTSNSTFEHYMKENILQPCGMYNSTFEKPEVPEHLATTAHVITEFGVSVSSVYPYNRIHAPSSTLHSNVNDMMNWAMTNLSNGYYLGNEIFSSEAHRMLTTPQQEASIFGYVGLSWFINKYKGKTIVSHGGEDTGFCTEFIMIPEDSIAVVCLANLDYFDAEDITDIVLKVIYGDVIKIHKKKPPITFVVGQELTNAGIEAARKKYFDLYKNSKEDYVFQEWCLRWLGYILLEQKRAEEAIDIFKFNVELYLESADVYDCLAEAYMNNGNNDMAIKYYRITHEKDPEDEWCVKMLKKLGVDIANE